MPLNHIVTVVLRLFAIQTFVQGLSLALSVTGSVVTFHSSSFGYVGYIVPAGLWIFAVLEWFLAPFVSRLVTRAFDSTLNITGLSREDLYSFAFIFLGLYFILTSIAPSLEWLHYYLTVSARSTGQGPYVQKSFYDLASSSITLIAGFVALLPANRWARKLISMERDVKPPKPTAEAFND